MVRLGEGGGGEEGKVATWTAARELDGVSGGGEGPGPVILLRSTYEAVTAVTPVLAHTILGGGAVLAVGPLVPAARLGPP